MTSARRSGIAWHPDSGSLLAVPGVENDVSMFERLSWNVAFSLKGPHSAAINLVSFSPNGEVQMTQAACLLEHLDPLCCFILCDILKQALARSKWAEMYGSLLPALGKAATMNNYAALPSCVC